MFTKSKTIVFQHSTAHVKRAERGFILIDVIVGIGLMALVLFSIFGVFQLSIKVITNSKARIGGLALAQEKVEMVRSMSYDAVGTVNGIPAGDLVQLENISLNNVSYIRRTLVQYVDDAKDGLGTNDINGITADYKSVKVEVSWNVGSDTKSLFMVTSVVPKGIETLSGGGTLIINVFDSLGAPVSGANVNIQNNSLNPTISVDVSTNAEGKVIFPGSPSGSNYEIVVTKSGFSSAQTYDSTTANPNPSPGYLSVIEGETTSVSFAIDTVGSKTIRTFSPIGDNSWTDDFSTNLNISTSASTTISGGVATLMDTGGSVYETYGYLYSTDRTPAYLVNWKDIAFNDTRPANTDILYKVYYTATSTLAIIPDTDLAGNSTGFSSSPIDISGLATTTYSNLQIAGFLSTTDSTVTPSLLDWTINYTEGPVPILDLPFSLRGDKTIGTDSDGSLIYKYDVDLQTDSTGSVTVSDLEWDNYTISVDSIAVGSDISEACMPQPEGLSPGESITTKLLLVPVSTNSLLVYVSDTLNMPLSGASARLYRTGYDTTQTTSSCGQTFFSNVASFNDYSLDISLSGYTSATETNIDISGTSTISVILDTI